MRRWVVLGATFAIFTISLRKFTDKGAAVEFVNERISVDKSGKSPLGSLMLGILAALEEFERRRSRELLTEGIPIVKAKGKYVQEPKLGSKEIDQAQAMIEMGIPKSGNC
ncbi:MAG: recombinase family protein [Yaniella sp.]|uniref:recombinase family protein n=1 Tax=Yaniella sp. TaxID=2773929 RepID=UPI003F9DAC0C